MTLPFDIARCPGKGEPVCEQCRRKEPGRPEWQTYISPKANGDKCQDAIRPSNDVG